jgi:hypothetical protein
MLEILLREVCSPTGITPQLRQGYVWICITHNMLDSNIERT